MASLRLAHPADPTVTIGTVPIPPHVVSDAERAAFAEFHRPRLLKAFRLRHRPPQPVNVRCTTCGAWVPDTTIGTHLRAHEPAVGEAWCQAGSIPAPDPTAA